MTFKNTLAQSFNIEPAVKHKRASEKKLQCRLSQQSAQHLHANDTSTKELYLHVLH